jgi:predicted  nucleic acid-binding Zn-ribbon protein
LHEEVEILKLENKGLKNHVESLKKEVCAIRGWEKEVRAQKEENENLKEQVVGLEKEVHILKDRDELWEKRIAAIEKLFRGKE